MGSRKLKILAAVMLSLVLIGVATGAVYAYLSATSGQVNNSFTPATEPDITIAETFPTDTTNPVKKNVCVNVGDPGYAVYVRAAIVVTWRDKNDDSIIYGQLPVVETDYTITLNTGDGDAWFRGSDGFYYLRAMFISNEDNAGKTPELITLCTQSQAGPDGYTLHVEIIAQTIQALGTVDGGTTPAVTDAWKVNVDPTTKELVGPT